MSNDNRHQRRRRRPNRDWVYKLVLIIGQAILVIVRYWFRDRQ